MKLRSLLKLTEQAPMMPAAGAPVAAPVAPPAGGMDMEPDPTAQAPSPDTTPTPEDPSEYDWTKDFRSFEDAKNKAESEGKKKLLDAMNEKLLGKTIVANASRGYGQPKTDYTIENVKKVSVEFWYKDYVVIVSDANDKKYFLTPGVNIKIESGETAGEEQPAAQAPQEPEAGAEQPPAAGQEAPNAAGPQTAPEAPAPEAPAPEGQPPAEQPPAAPPAAPQAAPQAPPAKPQAPQAPQQQPPEEEPPQVPPKKKKKLAEWTIQQDLSSFLTDFMSDSVKDETGNVNFVPYLKTHGIVSESSDNSKQKFLLEIPANHMVSSLDIREVKLAAIDSMRRYTRFGNYSKASIEIHKVGRVYLMEYVKETGWIK